MVSLAYISRWRLNTGDRCLLGFAAFAILHTLALLFSGEASLPHLLGGSAAWALGLLSYVGYRALLNQATNELALHIHVQIARFILVFACLESFVKLAGFGSVVHPLSEALSGKSSNRLLITTSEPSWAIQVAIYYLPFLLLNQKEKRSSLDITILCASPFILLSSFSLTGMLVLFIAILLFVFIDGLKAAPRRGGILFGTVLVLVSTMTGIVLLSDGGAYYVSRLYKIADLDVGVNVFRNLLLVDDSLMVRLGYPYLAFRMLVDHPLGVGIGQFGAIFPDYLQYLPAFGGFGQEVPEHVKNLNADTRNFYLKLLTENGILSSMFFFAFLFHLRQKISLISEARTRKVATLIFCVVLAMMMQFSTAYFACYWSFFALVHRLSTDAEN